MAQPQSPPVTPGALLPSGSRVVIVVSKGASPTPPAAMVSVPALVGLPQGDALGKLQEAGMTAQVFNDYSDRFKRGEVIGQLPVPNASAPAGSDAVLLVSSGAAASHTTHVTLPNVVGKTESEAVSALQTASLSPQVVHEYSASVPDGVVIAQLPNLASLAEQPAKRSNWLVWVVTAVVFVALMAGGFFILGGGKKVAVPDVTTQAQAVAEKMIVDAGLEVSSVTTTATSGAVEGTVMAQSPAGGEQVKKGAKVDLVVAGGKQMVQVPDVRNQNQADATKALQDAGLTVTVTRAANPTVKQGLVAEQTPPGGQSVPVGTTVGIVVSTGPEVQNVEVPDVVGMSQADANNALAEAGLKVAVG
ncbi:MAG: PASTA domain-containing protein, partial [Actinobacteria bacterium]